MVATAVASAGISVTSKMAALDWNDGFAMAIAAVDNGLNMPNLCS
jgi:hypothetical protein